MPYAKRINTGMTPHIHTKSICVFCGFIWVLYIILWVWNRHQTRKNTVYCEFCPCIWLQWLIHRSPAKKRDKTPSPNQSPGPQGRGSQTPPNPSPNSQGQVRHINRTCNFFFRLRWRMQLSTGYSRPWVTIRWYLTNPKYDWDVEYSELGRLKEMEGIQGNDLEWLDWQNCVSMTRHLLQTRGNKSS